jgi:anti-sigma B factor antagonist
MAGLEDNAVELRIDAESARAVPPKLALAGELDSSNAQRLEAAVAPIVEQGPERVVLDLSELRFMDSAGISVLVRLAAEVQTVEIRDPSPIVRRVIEVTGLTSVLQVDP